MYNFLVWVVFVLENWLNDIIVNCKRRKEALREGRRWRKTMGKKLY